MKKEKQRAIEKIDVVTATGVKSFSVGEKIDGIKLTHLYFEGDPYSHYVGYKNGKEVFRVSASCPVVVEMVKGRI